MIKVAIVYYSKFGHTEKVAKAIYEGVTKAKAQAFLIPILQDNLNDINWDLFNSADAIIFGAPTYMGSIAGGFKLFMEATSTDIWTQGKWRDKIAAGFTNSASYSGDKLCSIQQILHFAMQHYMIWVGQAELAPNFADNEMPTYDSKNRLGSWSGLMTQSNHKSSPNVAPPQGDLTTADLFGKRVVEVTKKFIKDK